MYFLGLGRGFSPATKSLEKGCTMEKGKKYETLPLKGKRELQKISFGNKPARLGTKRGP